MSSILKVRFPVDFEERYEKYKANFYVKNPSSQNDDSINTGIKKFPEKLPSGTRWEDFIIKFTDNEQVLVQVRGKSKNLSFEEMGFKDKRSSKPNSQWTTLLVLAKNGGEITWKSSDATEKFKKWKERLTTHLQEYFKIDYDPFYPYQDGKSYKIKMTLIPPVVNSKANKESMPDISGEVERMFTDLMEE